jgi:hypothetical protein
MAILGLFDRARHAARGTIMLGLLAALVLSSTQAASVTLVWDPSTDPAAAGYNVYFGASSRNYTNVADAGNASSATVSTLVPGATYFFAATTYNASGLESEYSTEVSYTVPNPDVNLPPTLNPISNLAVNQDSGPRAVNLSGISSGSGNEVQTLQVDAFSSNEGIIPKPQVDYTSPNSTGTLTFAPAAGSYGGPVTITVIVDDGGMVSNSIIRTFLVTVLPVNNPPTLGALSDLVIDQNAAPQTVTLTGISTGSPNEVQPLTVRASSSNPGLIPDPTVQYTSPGSTGTLAFQPVTNAFGVARITVTVSDGQPTNSLVVRSFAVQVNQTDGSGTNIVQPNAWTIWWQNTNGKVVFWSMEDTNLVSSKAVSPAIVDPSWHMVGTADFNGCGQAELLWQNSGGGLAAWRMDGTNCAQSLTLSPSRVDPNWRVAATGDFNADGQPDIVWQHSEGRLALWEMNSFTCTNVQVLTPARVDPGWRIAGTGHFSSPEHLDILWQSADGRLALWQMNGTTCTRSSLLNPSRVDPSWKIMATQEREEPGHVVILWQNTAGALACWQMEGTNFLQSRLLNPSKVDPAWRVAGAK